MRNYFFYLLAIASWSFLTCNSESSNRNSPSSPSTFTSFENDVDFLKKHLDVLILEEPSGRGKIAVSTSLQGRVMTSTANGPEGRSYGWINRELFESGDTMEHINVFGGEERFWLGPEGGQYSIFFEKETEFNLDNWYTPPLIDLEPFNLVSSMPGKAIFTKHASLTNYSGFTFNFNIERIVEILSNEQVFKTLGLDQDTSVYTVGYQTTNTLNNTGEKAWKKETGLLSIWLLGMFNPSPATTVVIPFIKGNEEVLGPIVNDTYFGKVPSDRLKIENGIVYFKGDGQYRCKIGLSPLRAKDVLGSYDPTSQTLTIVKYTKTPGTADYVNSLWELQDEPYKGDVVNSYNDGPPEPGAKPLGPFYELETSSPALKLQPGESGTHVQQTFHFEGPEEKLNKIAVAALGASLKEIKAAFQ